MMHQAILASLTISDWTFVVATIIGACVIVCAVVYETWLRLSHRKEQRDRAKDEAEVLREIIESLRSMKRGITTIKKKLDNRDSFAQRELTEAKRLILDVETRLVGHVTSSENRLTGQVVETKEIVRDTRSQITTIHGGQNNLGNNSIGGGQSQQ
jgi:hypothetical protein